MKSALPFIVALLIAGPAWTQSTDQSTPLETNLHRQMHLSTDYRLEGILEEKMAAKLGYTTYCWHRLNERDFLPTTSTSPVTGLSPKKEASERLDPAGVQYQAVPGYARVGLPGGIDGIDCIFYDAYGTSSLGTYPSDIGIAERVDTAREGGQ
ncbi:MAG: hypothetical protein WA960_03045 [Tunicatimonas sp.]